MTSKPKSVKMLAESYKQLKAIAKQERRNLQMMLAVIVSEYDARKVKEQELAKGKVA